jgi:hypothetical protein
MDKISPYKGCTGLLSQCPLYGLILVNFCPFLPIGKGWVLSLTSSLQLHDSPSMLLTCVTKPTPEPTALNTEDEGSIFLQKSASVRRAAWCHSQDDHSLNLTITAMKTSQITSLF